MLPFLLDDIMKIDYGKEITPQVKDFLVSIDKDFENVSGRSLSDVELEKFVKFFIEDIDYGQHSNNTLGHKSHAYEAFFDVVLNNLHAEEMHKKLGTGKEYDNETLINLIFRFQNYTCAFCGEFIKTQLGQDKILRAIDKPVVGHFATRQPPNPRCYNNDQIKLKIKMKSSKFVIANDLRSVLKTPLDFDDNLYNIGNPLGRVKATEHFAMHDVMNINTGNCTMQFYSKNTKEHVITDMYNPYIDEYDYSELRKSKVIEVNEIIDNGKYKLKNEISCSLWWLMGASMCDIDMDKLKHHSGEEYFVLNVKAGSTYIIEYDSQYRMYYKFYKDEE